jgi:SAM-dependent methyltransferase
MSDDGGDLVDPQLVRRTYGAMAEDYATTYADPFGELAIDREVVGAVLDRAPAGAPVVDVGCGPGHVAGYLVRRGRRAVGIDPTPEMLAVARRREPGVPFLAADGLRLPLRTGSCGGVIAFWVVHHLARPALPRFLAEQRRVLRPGSPLLLSAHCGAGTFTATGADGLPVVCTLYGEDELVAAVRAAGFAVDGVRSRDPQPAERPGERRYVAATAIGT